MWHLQNLNVVILYGNFQVRKLSEDLAVWQCTQSQACPNKFSTPTAFFLSYYPDSNKGEHAHMGSEWGHMKSHEDWV